MSKVIKLSAVLVKTGLSKSTVYALISEQLFPAPITLARRSVGWIEEEIIDWISKRPRAKLNIPSNSR